MTLVVVHGGQTGVDRGAFLGARDVGLPIAGYMPYREQDELGPIPDDVRASLWRCAVDGKDGGYRARTGANVELAHAVLLVVQDLDKVDATRGTQLTLDIARKRDKPILIASLDTTRNDLLKWIALVRSEYPPHEKIHLLVAGPRASKWQNGEAAARTIVSWLGEQQTAWPMDNFHPAGREARMTLDLWGPDTADRIISTLQSRYPIEFPYQTDWDQNGEISQIGRMRRELQVVCEIVFDDIKRAHDEMKRKEGEELAKAITGSLDLADVPLELLERTIEMLGRICVEKAKAEVAATSG